MTLIASTNIAADDEVRFQVYTGGHYPSGTSCKVVYHYAQMVKSGKFQEYDYGYSELNMLAYG
jgi:hypothetical protein